MKNHYLLALLVTTTLLGCGNQSEPAVIQSPVEAAPAVSQADAAKAHVQQYVDRLMGGDQSVKQGLLGMHGVDFDTIDGIQITSAVPLYLPDGRKVDNAVRVILQVQGYDSLKRRTIEKDVDLQVSLHDGWWQIVGSDL